MHELDKIARDLSTFDFKGTVVFDLLCVNGLSRNRFVSIEFDNEFLRSTKKPFKSESLEDAQKDFYSNNMDFLRASVLMPDSIPTFLRH
ncbi:TPA: type II toxin-antitoxin system RnlB family antitoxin [Vibrio fluvialis]|nr:type II toxin-antitoxin system RnlB family antitoxin [Vibrio fluvialis]HDV0903041.1 type II toxin-antitoxin system RnlB family antitoxin [Vibrio fluvialis]